MIISASRRTDIPAYYSDWFLNRLQEGFVCVRNPMNAHQISRIKLSNDVLDGIVFWTKNPLQILKKLKLLNDYAYYFQCTITPYDKDLEPNIPSKRDVIIPAVKQLANHIGAKRVIWRYDPIIISDRFTLEYHCEKFEEMAKLMRGSVRKCTISFVDFYQNAMRNSAKIGLRDITNQQMREIAQKLSEIALAYGIKIDTCAEQIDLSMYGIDHAHCIDQVIFEEILDCTLNIGKDKNQRQECGCVASIDVGVYNTCPNGCLYCYANFCPSVVKSSSEKHNPESSLLIGELTENDKVTDRKVESYRMDQIGFF